MEVEPQPRLPGDLALSGLGGGIERLEGHLRLVGAEGALAAALPGEVEEPGAAVRRDGTLDDPHHEAVVVDAGGGVVGAAVLVQVALEQALRAPLGVRLPEPEDFEGRPRLDRRGPRSLRPAPGRGP